MKNDTNNPKEWDWWYIDSEELKEYFEASKIARVAMKESECGLKGRWDDNDLWIYDDPALMKLFITYCDGFFHGALASMMKKDNNDDIQSRQMLTELNETDEGNIYTVINIEDYKDIK